MRRFIKTLTVSALCRKAKDDNLHCAEVRRSEGKVKEAIGAKICNVASSVATGTNATTLVKLAALEVFYEVGCRVNAGSPHPNLCRRVKEAKNKIVHDICR